MSIERKLKIMSVESCVVKLESMHVDMQRGECCVGHNIYKFKMYISTQFQDNMQEVCVKDEPEDVSEALLAELYADHVVKDELVLGPEHLHRPHVALVHRRQKNEIPRTDRNEKRIHTGKTHKCNHFTSHQKEILNGHERTHSGEKPYKCKHCYYRASSKTTLLVHEITHSRKKLHKCSSCNYTCAALENLIDHRKKHTRDLPYKCYASGSFKRHETTHIKLHHYQCNYCTYTNKRKRNLFHISQTHPHERYTYTCTKKIF